MLVVYEENSLNDFVNRNSLSEYEPDRFPAGPHNRIPKCTFPESQIHGRKLYFNTNRMSGFSVVILEKLRKKLRKGRK
jgi:hypothetical protein